MSIFRRKKQTDAETESLKSFLDMIAPSIVKFETGYYICGNTFRCIWAKSTAYRCTFIRAWSRRSKNAKSSITPRSATG